MKESYGKDLASHPDPESCVGARKGAGEALTGAHAGQPSSCEIRSFGIPTLLSEADGCTAGDVSGESSTDLSHSNTLSMCGNCLHGNRDIQVSSVADGSADRSGESTRHKPDMHDVGKSNDGIVPQKLPNKDRRFAEAMEGRPSTARNSLHLATPLTKIWTGVSSALQRVREVQASTPPTRSKSRVR